MKGVLGRSDVMLTRKTLELPSIMINYIVKRVTVSEAPELFEFTQRVKAGQAKVQETSTEDKD